MQWTRQRPFQALALTGGGYRGLFTARALQEIEDHLEMPIGRRFDLTYGTSIGGIIALAVAFEVPMRKVVETFVSHGQEIFPSHEPPRGGWAKGWDLYTHRNKPRYQAAVLRDVISKLLPADATLNDALHPCCVPAVNVTQGRPQVFKTRHQKHWTRDWKFNAVDVGVATAAAPTFFELAKVGDDLYADGGLFANAPDLLALHEAENYFNVRPGEGEFRLLSVGTTTKSYSVSFSAGQQFGVMDWMDDARLFSVTISAQQQLVDQLMRHKLETNYVRLDKEPSDAQASDLGLDIASETAQKTLLALAAKATSDILGTDLQPFLTHEPQVELFR